MVALITQKGAAFVSEVQHNRNTDVLMNRYYCQVEKYKGLTTLQSSNPKSNSIILVNKQRNSNNYHQTLSWDGMQQRHFHTFASINQVYMLVCYRTDLEKTSQNHLFPQLS